MLRSDSIRVRRSLSAVALLLLLSLLIGLTGCTRSSVSPQESVTETVATTSLIIQNGNDLTVTVGDSLQLRTNLFDVEAAALTWTSSSDAVRVNGNGLVTALRPGAAMVTAQYGKLTAMTVITVVESETETTSDTTPDAPLETDKPAETDSVTLPAPSETQEPTETEPQKPRDPIPEELGSPEGYEPAASYEEALDRSARGELSGYLWLPDQAPNIASNRPMQNGKYVRNSVAYFADENTYVVVDSTGEEVFRVYRGGGYITLEEVAAYLYAFGDVPANYTSKKVTSVGSSIWGEYLRGNHSKFSGSTSKYPYEPELPRISGCGGDLQYYEIDIGTTGTDCDPGYAIRPYNDGNKITRGAARIVYARFDANGNKVIDADEKFVFYTYNHYNDFREYLNYYNGWGEMFGNITGGGTLSSKYDYNPTPYVPVVLSPLGGARTARMLIADFRRPTFLAA